MYLLKSITLTFVCFITLYPSISLAQYIDKLDIEKLTIQFEDASDEIAGGYIPLLYRLADSLIANPSMHLLIRGHVCCVKSNKLAKRRAKAVRYYLELFQVNPEQLKIQGMRNSMPIVFPEQTKQDELTNMRVDFVIISK